jgi:hypothetical protein
MPRAAWPRVLELPFRGEKVQIPINDRSQHSEVDATREEANRPGNVSAKAKTSAALQPGLYYSGPAPLTRRKFARLQRSARPLGDSSYAWEIQHFLKRGLSDHTSR